VTEILPPEPSMARPSERLAVVESLDSPHRRLSVHSDMSLSCRR